MHEVSLAREIIGIVREQLNGLDPGSITRVNVRVGTSAGVAPESLRFAFQALTAGEPLQGADLVVHEVPFRLHCNVCEADSESPYGVGMCTLCGGTDVDILSGTELEVYSIELSEPVYEYHHD